MLPHNLLPSGHDTNGHHLAGVRTVSLHNGHALGPYQPQASLHGSEGSLVRHHQQDAVCVVWEAARARLAGRMQDADAQNSNRKVPPNNDVMRQMVGTRCYFSQLKVAFACS